MPLGSSSHRLSPPRGRLRRVHAAQVTFVGWRVDAAGSEQLRPRLHVARAGKAQHLPSGLPAPSAHPALAQTGGEAFPAMLCLPPGHALLCIKGRIEVRHGQRQVGDVLVSSSAQRLEEGGILVCEPHGQPLWLSIRGLVKRALKSR